MLEYTCDFYEFDASPASIQRIPALAVMMNNYAREGWTLVDVKLAAAGFLVIFSRGAKVAAG